MQKLLNYIIVYYKYNKLIVICIVSTLFVLFNTRKMHVIKQLVEQNSTLDTQCQNACCLFPEVYQ